MNARKLFERIWGEISPRRLALGLTFGVLGCLSTRDASALPFNQDMVGGQLIAGSAIRAKDTHAIPVGTLERQLPERQTIIQNWQNPNKGDLQSAVRGERLFKVNCMVCHGTFQKGQHVPSDLMTKGMPSLNLLMTQPKFDPGKTDGYVFAYIFNGMDAIMPRYGWRISNSEIWDLVSYVRKLQAENPL